MNKRFSPSRRDSPQERRRARRHLLVRRPISTRASADTRDRGKPVAPDEVDAFLAIDAEGAGHRLLRQGRSRHRRAHGADADRRRRARRADGTRRSVIQGDTLLTPDQGIDLGQPLDPGRRHAAAPGGGDGAAARCCRKRRRGSARQPDDLSVADGVDQREAGKTRLLWRARRRQGDFTLKLDQGAGQGQGPEATSRSSASRCRASTSPTRRPAASPTCRISACRACCMAASCARPRSAPCCRASTRTRSQDIAGVVQRRARGQFPRRRRGERMGRDQGVAALKATWSTLGDAARAGEAVGARAGHQGRQGRRHQQCRRRRRGARPKARKKLAATYDFAIHTHGSIGPSCAVAEFKDGELTSWTASQATHNLRKQLAAMLALPLDKVRCIYHRRLRLLRPQRARGRGGRRGASRQGGRQAGARAMVARGRARLGPEGPADADRPARRASTAPATSPPGSREFFIPQAAGGSTCRWSPPTLAGDAGRARTSRRATSSTTRRSRTPFPNVNTVCHRLETTPFRPSWIRTPGRMQNTFANECFIDELAAAAGADPLEFRLQVPRRPARHRAAQAARRRMAKWEKRPSPQKPAERRRRQRPRHRLRQIRADAHLCRRGGRGRGRPQRPARSACRASSWCMIAARSSTRTACATRSRATSSRP